MFDKDRTRDTVEDITERVEEMFEELEGMAEDARGVRKTREGEDYVIDVDVPGFEASDLDVTVKEHILLVNGETHHGGADGGHRKLNKRIPLYGDLNHGEATAQVERGVLTVRIPYTDQSGTPIDVN